MSEDCAYHVRCLTHDALGAQIIHEAFSSSLQYAANQAQGHHNLTLVLLLRRISTNPVKARSGEQGVYMNATYTPNGGHIGSPRVAHKCRKNQSK